jgi:hypothetical protein
VRVRLGLHTGEPVVGEEGYTGLDVVRAARIAALGRGGQVLLSETTRAIVADDLPDGVDVRDLGQRELKDVGRPEQLFELVISDVEVTPPEEVPPSPSPAPTLTPAMPTRSPGERVIEAALAGEDVPDWVRRSAAKFVPEGALDAVGAGSHGQLEQRILSAIEEAMRAEKGAPASKTGHALEAAPLRSGATNPSVADEVARLRDLRDGGALTDEQYSRAVERTIETR